MLQICPAREEDASGLLDIYRSYIDTPVTFECQLPTLEEFAGRIRRISREYPYLVCRLGGEPVGYAYAHRYQERAAYQWNAELSVYLSPSHTGRGIGRALYSALLEILKLQNIQNVYGIVTAPNPPSEGLHRALGFTLLGSYHGTGFKCGRWHDVQIFERQLGAHEDQPRAFLPVGQLDGERISAICDGVLPLMR